MNYWKLGNSNKCEKPELAKNGLEMIKEIIMTDFITGTFNVSLFNSGNFAEFRMFSGSVNKNGNLHGLSGLILNDIKHLDNIGVHPFLKWKPIHVMGKFSDGVLNGPVILGTNNSNIIFAYFQNGVMNGPIYAQGTSLIYTEEYLVSFYHKNH